MDYKLFLYAICIALINKYFGGLRFLLDSQIYAKNYFHLQIRCLVWKTQLLVLFEMDLKKANNR